MAGGVWRANGFPAVSISIKGPGLVNMVPGIAYNYFENQPVISIAEAYNSNIPKGRMHKKLNQYSILKSLTQGVVWLKDPPREIPKLITAASTGIRGPVHVELNDSSAKIPTRSKKVIGESKSAFSIDKEITKTFVNCWKFGLSVKFY